MNPARRQSMIIVLAFIAFVSLGLPDGVLGVAWPSIRGTFGLPLSHLGMLLAAGTSGYLLSSFCAGQVIRAFGIGRVLLGSSLLATTALTGNALAPAWWWLVSMAFIGGLAGGAIDSGINTFAAARFSPRVVNWLHAFWGVGATTGPFLMTAVLASHRQWRAGYGILAAALGLLSVLFMATLKMWTIGPSAASTEPTHRVGMGQALRRPVILLHMAMFFMYAGVESTAGQLLYSLFTESRGIAPTVAGVVVGMYWGALTCGRIVFGQLAMSLSRRAVLRLSLLLAPVGAMLLSMRGIPTVSFVGAVLLGFSIAPIFPTLISVTPRRVGEAYAAHAVGFQIASAAIGVATLPALVGLLSRWFGLEVLCVELLAASLVLLALHECVVRLYDSPQAAPVLA